MKRIPTFIVNYSVKANNSKHLVHIVNKFLEAYKQNWKVEGNKNRRGKSQLKVHEIKINYEVPWTVLSQFNSQFPENIDN